MAYKVLPIALWLCRASVFAQSFSSFSLYDREELDDAVLSTSCVNSLTFNIQDCHPYVQEMTTRSYRGALNNVEATNQVCTQDCSSSLASWFWAVSSNYRGAEVNNDVPQLIGGFMWSGWNETCVRDPRTRNYCNGNIHIYTHFME